MQLHVKGIFRWHGNTPLHEAVRADILPMMKLLLSREANMKARGPQGLNPLQLAVTNYAI
jgi:ankyrin repeat protein